VILGFKTSFPWGGKTNFVEKILASQNPFINYIPKLHTVREGQRWKPGYFIHMAIGVRTSAYQQFNVLAEGLQKVKSVQRIDIIHRGPKCALIFVDRKLKFSRIEYLVSEDGGTTTFQKVNGICWLLQFLKNDGFESEEDFWRWFSKPIRNGQLIHWTDLKY
jgi:hypothetical protein